MKNNTNAEFTSYYLLFAILSLFLGFFLGENSSGGAYLDYLNQKKLSISFSNNFLDTINNYEKFNTRHSPIVPIILGVLEQFKINDFILRFIYLVICLSLPITFYKCLNLKFKKTSKEIIFFITSLIFLSPIFRSLTIWPDSRILGLSFFSISVFFYLKFINKKGFKYAFGNICFLSLASYISPNFSVFSVFFFYKFFECYKFSKEIFHIILINLILSLPAFFFIFVLDHNFIFKHTAISHELVQFNKNNYFNKILIISSILFFYLLPFAFTKIIEINFKKIFWHFVISIIITVLCIIKFKYPYISSGGGIFLKFSLLVTNDLLLFYIICFLSIFVFSILLGRKFENFLLFLLLIISNPQLSIYHKYYDPFYLILFFLLLNLKINIQELKNSINKFFIFSFFSIFLFINLIKNYL